MEPTAARQHSVMWKSTTIFLFRLNGPGAPCMTFLLHIISTPYKKKTKCNHLSAQFHVNTLGKELTYSIIMIPGCMERTRVRSYRLWAQDGLSHRRMCLLSRTLSPNTVTPGNAWLLTWTCCSRPSHSLNLNLETVCSICGTALNIRSRHHLRKHVGERARS